MYNNVLSSGVSPTSQHILFLSDMAIIAIIIRALDCNNRKQKISVTPNPKPRPLNWPHIHRPEKTLCLLTALTCWKILSACTLSFGDTPVVP